MEFSSIGFFTKTHGVKGHLILREEADFEVEGLTAFFIEADGIDGNLIVEIINNFSSTFESFAFIVCLAREMRYVNIERRYSFLYHSVIPSFSGNSE